MARRVISDSRLERSLEEAQRTLVGTGSVANDPGCVKTRRLAKAAKATLGVERLDAVADRGYFSGEEILACENAGITVTLPKPMTSNSKAEGALASKTSAT